MTYLPWLGLLSAAAACVHGGLGYGFSSLVVPLALLFVPNRLLNPALVLVEVGLNAYVVAVNRRAVPTVWPRVLPLVVGLAPGIAVGTFTVSHMDAEWLKLTTYTALLPMILLQAAGLSPPMRVRRLTSAAAGAGIGMLYSVTTISGPPLAVMLANQGLANAEFRAAMGLVRCCESALTAAAYMGTGLVTRESLDLVPSILPSVAIGVPAGTWLLRHVPGEAFRRASMGFDALVVAFGAASVLRRLGLAGDVTIATLFAGVLALDAWLLRRFFASPARHAADRRCDRSGSPHGDHRYHSSCAPRGHADARREGRGQRGGGATPPTTRPPVTKRW